MADAAWKERVRVMDKANYRFDLQSDKTKSTDFRLAIYLLDSEDQID